jgi:hypothetical protein
MNAGVLEHGLPDHPGRDGVRVVEPGGHPLGLLGDLLQGLLAVEVLAPGQEPDLRAGVGVVHERSPHCP